MRAPIAFLAFLFAALPAWAGCPRPTDAAGLAACAQAANTGDAGAALVLGDALGDRGGPAFSQEAAFAWWTHADRLGEPQAARRLFDAYTFGRGVPVDPTKAAPHLEKALARGEIWAMLAKAVTLEESDPAGADALYRRAAEEGNCRAQMRLAEAYDKAHWGGRNRAQAYLWALIANRNGSDAQTHPLFERRFSPGTCTSEAYFLRSELAGILPADAKASAEAAAELWRPGTTPIAQASTEPRAVGDTAVLPGKVADDAPAWKPLPASARRTVIGPRRPVEELFAQLRPSVWVVVAARDEDSLKANKVAIGSAVAVTDSDLLTNCHVVENLPYVHVKQEKAIYRVEVTAADLDGDRCRLRFKGGNGPRLVAVPGVRPYGDIKVGEPVLTIGAPRGLEATLGQGNVSALRRRGRDGLALIQLTAPISPGSSGGGLFDASGNLAGITTFMLRDSQGLNFAIAADEFFQ